MLGFSADARPRCLVGIALVSLAVMVSSCSSSGNGGESAVGGASISEEKGHVDVDLSAVTLAEGDVLEHLRYTNYGADYAALKDSERIELAKNQDERFRHIVATPEECVGTVVDEGYVTGLVAEHPGAMNVVAWQPKPEDYVDNDELETYAIAIADARLLGDHGELKDSCREYSATIPVGAPQDGYTITQHFRNTPIEDVTLDGVDKVSAFSTVTWVDGDSPEANPATYYVRAHKGGVVVEAQGVDLDTVVSIAQAQVDKLP